MWYAFFMVGGVWFWLLAVVELVLLSIFVQDENSLPAFLSVLAFILLIHLFGDASFFKYIKDNPLDIIRWGILYIGLGFGWAITKYFYVSKRVSNKILEIKEQFHSKQRTIIDAWVKRHNSKVANIETVWQDYLDGELTRDEKNKLNFYHQGAKIIFWMAYWPVSMFWTFFTDILKNLAEWCYETFLVSAFKKVHNNTIGSAVKLDIKEPEKLGSD